MFTAEETGMRYQMTTVGAMAATSGDLQMELDVMQMTAVEVQVMMAHDADGNMSLTPTH